MMKQLSYALPAVWAVGAVVSATLCPIADVIAHDGTPVGEEKVVNGLTMYVSEASQTEKAVLYLTDVFGIQLPQNKLLADSFARAGYLTVAPDMFNGTPAPADLNTPGFNTTAFLAAHGPEVTDPIIDQAVAYMRDTLGVQKIGVSGYCFGGRYAFRFGAPGKGADVVYAAHPSYLGDSEIIASDKPASIAAAEVDTLLTPDRRAAIEALFRANNATYQVDLYGGVSHGFGVRANVTDPKQKFGKETAFLQAVRWFDAWL